MQTLQIDIETYSPVDIKKSGVYPYANHPEFQILLFAYAFDDEPVRVIDMASGEAIPREVFQALYGPSVLKTAFNALFERTCINAYLNSVGMENLRIEQWECTMIKAAMLGLPLSLGKVAEVLQIQSQKMLIGMQLIRYFCIPCKPSATNGGRTRNLPHHDPAKWTTFKLYNKVDVETERGIRKAISYFEIPKLEKLLYILDMQINDRGVLIDRQFVENAINIDIITKERLMAEAIKLTGIDNPNSGAQMKAWLLAETGEDIKSLTKASIPDILKRSPGELVEKVMGLKLELSKTSVKKYQAMVNAAGQDNRIRGLSQFYGANRTGRWSGRFVQMQNLPQNHLVDLGLARNLVMSNDPELVEMFFGNVPDTLSQLIRTSFIAEEGKLLYVADFSAIEARVAAFLADEKWVIEVFATHGKIYEATAANMFKVPLESVTKGSVLRQKGKVSSLALQYGGGVNALTVMDTAKSIDDKEKPGLVAKWRETNPNIVAMWYAMDRAAKRVLKEGGRVNIKHGVAFEYRNNNLYMHLPSGRSLCYVNPSIGENRFGGESINYWGMDQMTKKWCKQETYSGKLFENLSQAMARDCLAVSMLRLDKAGYALLFHVHDEVIISAPKEGKDDTVKDICRIMGEPISWAPGLFLKAEGYFGFYYRKD